MSRHERFRAAVECEPVDRVPVSAWMHLASEHLAPGQVADLHAAYWRAYDWDVLKVMDDYRVDIPLDWASFDTDARLACLQTAVAASDAFERQYACMAALMQRLGTEVPLLDSGYDPYAFVLRHIGHDQAPHLMARPNALAHVLETVAERMCQHMDRLKSLGVTGYFHATWGGIPAGQPRGMSQEVFERWVRPWDLHVLNAAEGLVRVLHAHGSGLALHRLEGYPHEVLHVADHTPGNPTLAELRRWTPKCLMGGVDERQFTALSLPALVGQIEDAVAQVGQRGFILAPGCAVPSSSSQRLLRALRSGAEGFRSASGASYRSTQRHQDPET